MFQTKQKKLIYENRWIRLWEDDIILPNGKSGIYGYVERRDEGVFIIPITDDGRFVLLREWRYPIQGWTWCWPGGGSNTPDEDKLTIAKRELEEETGFVAREWIDLGTLHIDPGLSRQHERYYLARGLAAGAMALESTEVHEVHIKSREEIETMIASSEMDNGWLLAGWAKVRVYLENRTR